MITPSEVEKLIAKKAEFDAAEKHIDEALKKGRFPCTFSTRLYWLYDLTATEMAARYAAAGWDARVMQDSRDGDYLSIDKKTK